MSWNTDDTRVIAENDDRRSHLQQLAPLSPSLLTHSHFHSSSRSRSLPPPPTYTPPGSMEIENEDEGEGSVHISPSHINTPFQVRTKLFYVVIVFSVLCGMIGGIIGFVGFYQSNSHATSDGSYISYLESRNSDLSNQVVSIERERDTSIRTHEQSLIDSRHQFESQQQLLLIQQQQLLLEQQQLIIERNRTQYQQQIIVSQQTHLQQQQTNLFTLHQELSVIQSNGTGQTFSSFQFTTLDSTGTNCVRAPVTNINNITVGQSLLAANRRTIIIPSTGYYRLSVAVSECGCPVQGASATFEVNESGNEVTLNLPHHNNPTVRTGCGCALVYHERQLQHNDRIRFFTISNWQVQNQQVNVLGAGSHGSHCELIDIVRLR